jgi:hypothetical protein
MDNVIIREDEMPMEQAPQPAQWTWISQREVSDGKAASIWKFGFFAPDGAEVRVTFHQTDQQPKSEDATFYVTFFTNRNPIHFMKWDVALSHEDSLIVWVTITHGLVDFIRKANPNIMILDDLGNGKLKMVLRSVSMDVAESNAGYELEQTKRSDLRTFYQIKKRGVESAFNAVVKNTPQEAQTNPPAVPSPDNPPQKQANPDDQAAPAVQQPEPPALTPPIEKAKQPEPVPMQVPGAAMADPTAPDPTAADPAQAMQPPAPKRGLTIEIGRDYSIAVKDKDGLALDRYRAKAPADILRWVLKKGYAGNKMVIVDAEKPSGAEEEAEPNVQPDQEPSPVIAYNQQHESVTIAGKKVVLRHDLTPKQAAIMNAIVNATAVRHIGEGVEFEFSTEKDMDFKKALVELAYNRISR